MKSYTKVYLDHFGYSISDFIHCEICGDKAIDIHHIHARSKRKDLENDIANLMAVCRICHEKYGDNKQFQEQLQNIHDNRIKRTSKNIT
jgi:5-methylcytosine-specific restriction endonuclease McrA